MGSGSVEAGNVLSFVYSLVLPLMIGMCLGRRITWMGTIR
jgi:hypothetical protein